MKFELWEFFNEEGNSYSVELCEAGKSVNLDPPEWKKPRLLKVFEARDIDEATQMRNDFIGWGKHHPTKD